MKRQPVFSPVMGQVPPRRGSPAPGFTLIEILVVLVLVSIISVGAFTLLDTFNHTDQVLQYRAEEMRRFSMAMYRIDDDLRQVTPRPVKNAYSGYEPALRGDSDELEFTRLGASNFTGEPRGELQRVSYRVGFAEDPDADSGDQESLLLRGRWRILDRAPDSEPVSEPLLAGVDSLSLRYFDGETEAWLSQWPPASSTTDAGAVDLRLPRAVEFVLLTQASGELRRVFVLPSGAVSLSSNRGGGGGGGGGGDGGGSDNNDGSQPKPGDGEGDNGGKRDG
ncbi:type II secretion system minor pseudopilin GspJ [Microbulbifer discodermiae]|uniref:type II secretion system minor pseudopilin GspJ n=1 Tax=Microbulbifer sp. 2201CG32-9 TaxID=3232309 RepID=UPI00345BE386